jgi:hypothetical protein
LDRLSKETPLTLKHTSLEFLVIESFLRIVLLEVGDTHRNENTNPTVLKGFQERKTTIQKRLKRN